MKCPCCTRGELGLDRICNSCGVAVARGSEAGERPVRRWTPKRRQDQDVVRPSTDYARTKEDKQ